MKNKFFISSESTKSNPWILLAIAMSIAIWAAAIVGFMQIFLFLMGA